MEACPFRPFRTWARKKMGFGTFFIVG